VRAQRGRTTTTGRRGARRILLPLLAAAGVALAVVALARIGFGRIGDALLSVDVPWALASLALMCASLVLRADAWHAVLRAAGTPARPRDALRGTMIGVLVSAALPGRLGEPARAFVVSRRLGDPRRWFATVVGAIFAQTLLNIFALGVLAVVAVAGAGLFQGHTAAIVLALGVPLVIAAAIVAAPPLLGRLRGSRVRRLRAVAELATREMANLRRGLFVFRRPGTGVHATLAQLAAWALQWLACYTLIVAFGLEHRSGLAAAAGVLLAVNVTAVLPATPSNVGIFQAACVVVLAAYHVPKGDALAYGIALQAIEVATALLLGVPALASEGLSWNAVVRTADELAHGGAQDQARENRGQTMPRVQLRDISTPAERAAVMGLRRGPGQDRYVSSMEESFAEADSEPRAMPRPWAVHDAETGELVGFAMISDGIPEPMDEDLVGPYFLWKLLVDARFQGRGYGAATIAAVVEYVRTRPGADVLYTSCTDGPGSPRGFYLGLGFTDTGRIMWGENVLALDLAGR
jgi:uncharacterized protein (TIRG00374 family)